MNEEEVIRKEATDFFEQEFCNINASNPVRNFHDLKDRLQDFYSDSYKSIFLDEIQLLLNKQLEQHRKECHKGIAQPDCVEEIITEKLLFYINQEIGTFPIVAHEKAVIHPKHERNQIFISYSHLDKSFLADVKRHFKPFHSQINYWDDTKIDPGQKWKEEIRKAIDKTKVAILLVSTDFLGSDFILTNELPPLLKAADEDGAVILTMIIKPCLFEEFPSLNQYQAMNPPNKPMLGMGEQEKEELLVNLVRQTKRVLEKSPIS